MTAHRLPLLAGIAAMVVLGLAACVPPTPEPMPAPTPAPAPAPSPTTVSLPPPPVAEELFANWADAPATPGDWHYRVAGRDRIAEFRSHAGGQIAQLICTADRDMQLAVIARVPNAAAITVRTEFGTRALAADAMESSISTLLDPADPLLDQMAFSKGRFALQIAGGPQLYLPSWPEVVRVIEECR